MEHDDPRGVLRELQRVRAGRAPEASRVRARVGHVVVVDVEGSAVRASQRRFAGGIGRRVGTLTRRVVAAAREAAEPIERRRATQSSAARRAPALASIARHRARQRSLRRFPRGRLLQPSPDRFDRREDHQQKRGAAERRRRQLRLDPPLGVEHRPNAPAREMPGVQVRQILVGLGQQGPIAVFPGPRGVQEPRYERVPGAGDAMPQERRRGPGHRAGPWPARRQMFNSVQQQRISNISRR